MLSVTGASAIFTQDLGADPTEAAAATGPEHGPVVPAELKQAATQAAIRLCGGDPEQAKALWETHPGRARRLHARGRGASAGARRREQHPA